MDPKWRVNSMPSDLLIPFYFTYAAVWILLILHSLILLGVVRMVYQLQRAGSASVGEGKEAPKFNTVTVSGHAISSNDFVGRMAALLFVSPSCSACIEALADDMEYLQYKAKGNVIVVCRAACNDCARLIKEYELNVPVIADNDEQFSKLFNVSTVPTVVLINENNRIQSVGHPEQVEKKEALVPEPITQGVG